MKVSQSEEEGQKYVTWALYECTRKGGGGWDCHLCRDRDKLRLNNIVRVPGVAVKVSDHTGHRLCDKIVYDQYFARLITLFQFSFLKAQMFRSEFKKLK